MLFLISARGYRDGDLHGEHDLQTNINRCSNKSQDDTSHEYTPLLCQGGLFRLKQEICSLIQMRESHFSKLPILHFDSNKKWRESRST